MFGTAALRKSWIESIRARRREAETTLAEARVRAGLRQAQVAERMGSSQSDVSELERRADLRLSTLRACASGIGAHLVVAFHGLADEGPRFVAPVTIPRPLGACLRNGSGSGG